MHKIGSLTWRIIFSLSFMSHLCKEISCEFMVRKLDKRLEQKFVETQLPEMTTEYSKQIRLIGLGLHQITFDKALIPGIRSAGKNQAGSECQRHEMYVNFITLGWNTWMIYPRGYHAYYCAGECPLQLANLNYTKHAQIKSIMSKINPHIPTPCCVPTKLLSLQLLYYVNSLVTDEQWDELLVEACGCR